MLPLWVLIPVGAAGAKLAYEYLYPEETTPEPTTRTYTKARTTTVAASKADPDPYKSIRVSRSVSDETAGYEWMAVVPILGQTAYPAIIAGINADIKAHPTRIVWDPEWPAAATGKVDTGVAVDLDQQRRLYGEDLDDMAKRKAYYATDSKGSPVLAYGWDKLP